MLDFGKDFVILRRGFASSGKVRTEGFHEIHETEVIVLVMTAYGHYDDK